MNFETEVSSVHLHKDIDDGSRQASSSPYSGKAKIVSDCDVGVGVGNMYDPFVDSFEPTTSLKLDCVHEHELAANASISSNRPLAVDKEALSESDMTARVSVSSNKPPDVEVNTAGNNSVGAVVSVEKDGFVEDMDIERECNSHETETPNSNQKVNDDELCEGDDDNNTKEKSREKKDSSSSSRSMKLFKVVLTKFVKDLLKPSWRQGNMSKEAFKTIVKRAVEKVSNSMEGRRMPKSRAKIDRYIDSSQHKLTKLVMGYVDKYVKA